MNELGKIVLNSDTNNVIKVYVSVVGDEVFYEMRPGIPAILAGYVSIIDDGVFAGGVDEMNRYFYDVAEKFLFENGFLKQVKSSVMFSDYDYFAGEKLKNLVNYHG